MAKTATRTRTRTKAVATAKPRASGNRGGSRGSSSGGAGAGDAFIKLLQSPLVADLIAVAATAALAALAEHGFSSRGDASGGKRAGKAVKEAGRAAAAAIGRRLSTEIDEIRKASTKDGEAAKA
jgi:hypothetical protein